MRTWQSVTHSYSIKPADFRTTVSNGTMKLSICVCVLMLAKFGAGNVAVSPELHEVLEGLQKQCEQETEVDVAVINEAKKMHFTPDPKFKCFLKCMMTNMQVMTEDGVFDKDTVLANIPEEIIAMGAVKVIENCHATKGTDPCDTAYELVKCFSKHAGEIAEVFT